MEPTGGIWMVLLLVILSPEGESLQDASAPLEFVLLEEQPAGTSLGNIFIASGLHRQFNSSVLSQLRLSFLTQPNPERPYFIIQEHTGILRTTREVDREEVCRPTFADTRCLLALDLALQPAPFFRILKVKVEVLDINDHVPTFTEKKYNQVISESTDVGTGFAIPPAVDWDSGKFGIKRYDMKPKMSMFELRTSTSFDSGAALRLVLKEKLDREREPSYEMIVYAVDGGHPALTGSMTIHVEVGDANDNQPTFHQSTYEVTVAEGVAPGITLLVVQATDLDIGPNGEVHYEFAERTAEQYGDVFEIDPTSGEIFVRGELDHEAHPVYHLSILACDRGPDSLPGQTTVLVYVTDINDNPPEVEVSFLTSSGQAEVMENAPIGTFVAFISVFDSDDGKNGEFECFVTSGKEFGLEQIYSTQFKVVTGVTFDREFQATAQFGFQCQDHGIKPLTSGMQVNVEILDENDNAPEFLVDSYQISVTENNEIGLILLKVQAHDKDFGNNSLLTYHLDKSAPNILDVEPETGNIRATGVFNHEMSPQFEFRVLAIDRGVPVQSGTAAVRIDAIDVDDERPKFMSETYTFEIHENQPIGSEVGKVVAKDLDSPPFNKFSYVLESDSQDSIAFSVDSFTGSIITREVLDREVQATYRLVISARSETATNHSTSSILITSKTQVTIHVIDINDNAPQFIVPDPDGNTIIEVSSLAGVGHVILLPKVEDEDSSGVLKVSFSISGANGTRVDDSFRVNTETGSVAVNGDLGPMARTEVVLFLTVADTGYPVLNSSVYFRIVIRKDEALVSFFIRLISGDFLTSAVAIVIGLALVILVLVLVLVALCLVKRNTRSRKRNGGTEGPKSHPPDIVCCQLDEGATPTDLLIAGRPVKEKVQLQVIVAPPDDNGKQTIRTEAVTSPNSPGNDSGRGSCEEYIDQLQRDQMQREGTSRSKEPLATENALIMAAKLHNHVAVVEDNSANLYNVNSHPAIDQESPNTIENGQKTQTTRLPDRLSRFMGARPTQVDTVETGIQLQPLLSHDVPSLQDSKLSYDDESPSGTWRMNSKSPVAFCRTETQRMSSSSRDERVARASLKAGKYFMYEPVDGGL